LDVDLGIAVDPQHAVACGELRGCGHFSGQTVCVRARLTETV
jgi:hypothetical protein